MDGYVTIGTNLDTKSFDAQIDYVESQLQEIEDKIKQADMGFEVGDTQKLESQYEKLIQKLSILRQKQADLNKTDLSNIQKSINNVGNSTSNVIKKVGKWALAIFGVRSAYMFVRQSASTLAQYNEKIGADLEYIRFALASSLQPVIERLIQLVYKLLNYVNYIVQAWFGVNLFANASAKAMNKGAKSAEQMKKSLAGFDEMNIMQDTSTGGAGGGETAPSIDLSQWQGEIPSWIQWIADNKDIVIAGLLGIAGGLTAVSFGLTAIKGLGIGVAIAGITYSIQGLLKYLKDPSWTNFGQIIQGIGIAITGLGITFLGLPAIVTGVVVGIVGTIVRYWEQIKATITGAVAWLEGSINSVYSVFGNTIGKVYEVCIDVFKGIIIGFDEVFRGIKRVLDGIIGIVMGVFTGDWKRAWQGVVDVFSGIFIAVVGIFRTVVTTIGGMAVAVGTTVGNIIAETFKAVVNGVLWAIENILNTPIKTINSLIKTINKVPGINLGTLKTFNLPRLAVGGIVNMPGRGVPIGGAITGEAGREGVIPLTDSQAMETLGATIGKYININLTNITKLDNRQIAKEQKKINAQSDFAFNR